MTAKVIFDDKDKTRDEIEDEMRTAIEVQAQAGRILVDKVHVKDVITLYFEDVE